MALSIFFSKSHSRVENNDRKACQTERQSTKKLTQQTPSTTTIAAQLKPTFCSSQGPQRSALVEVTSFLEEVVRIYRFICARLQNAHAKQRFLLLVEKLLLALVPWNFKFLRELGPSPLRPEIRHRCCRLVRIVVGSLLHFGPRGYPAYCRLRRSAGDRVKSLRA